MKYFNIEESMNRKILGKVEQTKEIIHNCHIWDEPRFIDRMFYRKIEGLPILSNVVLHPKANVIDLIRVSSVGFSRSMLISDKLKCIFEKFNLFGLQFFPTFMIQNNARIEGYWQTHISEQAFDLLDFEKLNFTIKTNNGDGTVSFEEINHIKTLTDFLKSKEENKFPTELYFRNLVLKDEKFDFFFMPHFINGTGRGTVSERLKLEIENQGITGIEFRPIEISFQEWLQGGEREKIYGKS